MESRYSISLIYTNGQTTLLRVLITNATSDEQALGKAILYFEPETKDHTLASKVVIKIKESEQIEQLQEENSKLKEDYKEDTLAFGREAKRLTEENNRLKGLLKEAWIASAENSGNVFINEDLEDILFEQWLEKNNIKI